MWKPRILEPPVPVSPQTCIKEPPGSTKDSGSFPGSYSTCSKQCDHPRPYTHGLFDHYGYISKPDICFLIITVINVMPGEGLVWFLISATLWLPPIGNGGTYRPRRILYVVLDRLRSGFGPGSNRTRSIVYTQLLLGYGHCCCYHF
jgi:hypothetical protein